MPAANTPSSPTRARRTRARVSREQSRARIIDAATELVRDRSYAELSVGEVMERAGSERTIFYRHFDDLGDLLMQAGTEAIEGLYEAQVDMGSSRDGFEPGTVRAAMEPCVHIYREHGPVLRALSEAAAVDERIAEGQRAMYRRFDQLVADSIRGLPGFAPDSEAALSEVARALNLLNTSYLLDCYGREPRIPVRAATTTLTKIWSAVIGEPKPVEEGA
jgi:TetR/AcrR family transcriptional regulator, ethionamide resistance regulator